MSEQTNINSLTEGPIVGKLLKLSLPIMASSFLGTAYNLMDMAWVGTLGAKAVAGVGVGGMYLWFSNGLATLARMGGQVNAAQSIGMKKTENARQYARASLQIVTLFAIIFAAVCLIFMSPLIGFFKLGEAETINYAARYMRITCGFVLFNFLNYTLAGLYTAQGDSKTPLIANFIGLVLNMILDPLLIIGPWFFPRLEETGAAIATVFSQFVVTLVLVYRMRRTRDENDIFYKQKYLRPTKMKFYKDILRLGFPMALQSTIYCFISMVLARMIAAFGPEAVAVQRVGGQIESITWNTADGFAAALNAFCGQNYGAKKMDRIKKGYQFAFLSNFIWGTFILILFVLCPGPISKIFFHEELAIAISVSYLFIIGFSEPFMAVELVTCGGLAGLGKTRLCSVISIIFTALRIPMAFVLEHTALGLDGIWWALTITSIIKGVIFYFTFNYITSKNMD